MASDLKSWSITGTQDGPHLLITGGVHGDEYEPMQAVWSLSRTIQPSTLRGRITLVPCVNESAFVRTSRTAEDGLDLARTCPGRADGSITERIAHGLSGLIQTADYYIDLHTGGVALTVYPLVGYMLHPRPEVLNQQRKMAAAFGLPLIWGTDPHLNGRSLSVARDANVPAIYAEYLGGGPCNPSGIRAYMRGCLRTAASLGMIDGDPTSASGTPPLIVEDSRPNSGYMQIQHPAPCDGIFVSAVTLGQRIQRGDLFGTVTDLASRREEQVPASQSGCVIVLRHVARVSKNDSLGVVVETDATLPCITIIESEINSEGTN